MTNSKKRRWSVAVLRTLMTVLTVVSVVLWVFLSSLKVNEQIIWWSGAIAIVFVIIILLDVILYRPKRFPERITGTVLAAHQRTFFMERCTIRRVLYGVLGGKKQRVNVVRIDTGKNIRRIVVIVEKPIAVGSTLRLRLFAWDDIIGK